MISKDIASASESSSNDSNSSSSDLDEDGKDKCPNNVSHLMEMHLF